MPTPVRGARPTDGASQIAAIRRSSNAGPPFSAWGILPAKSIPRNGLRDGRRRLEYPRLAEALSAQLLAKSHAPQRAHDPTIRPLCKMALWSPDQARGDAHGMELKRSRNRLRIFAGASRHSWSADV